MGKFTKDIWYMVIYVAGAHEHFRFPLIAFFLNFLNYQQHKVGISANYFFPFIPFRKFITVTHKFGGISYLIF